MDEWTSNLTLSLGSVISQEDVIQRVMEVIINFGVSSAMGLKYVEADDLAGALKPIEARKVIAHFKFMGMVDDSFSNAAAPVEESSTGEDSFFSDLDDSFTSDHSTIEATATRRSGFFMASPSVPHRSSPSVPSAFPSAMENNSWHYSFDIPWSKLTSTTRKLLDDEQRPSAAESRKIIRIVIAEIFTAWKKPGKRHIVEIARKMITRYPKSFRDEIEGQVVGTGYDSVVSQLMSRIDNCRRLQAPAKKRHSKSGITENVKKGCKDAYGCINPDPELPAGETRELQKIKQEELIQMFKNKDEDSKKMEQLMLETFSSQRRDILSGQKETKDIIREWPFLFHETGMKLHFRQLTGIHIDDCFEESAATKFRRILRYFQFAQTDSTSKVGSILSEILQGCDETCAAVLMLLAHFKEQEDKMFLQVDDTAVATDVDTTKLPWTPCIVVCGNSPFSAKMFMIAVDQVIVNDQLPSFKKAFQMMFCSYDLHNIDYPVETAATLEFLQRCIFKMNPDQGTKVSRKEKRCQYAVSPRVLSLITKISNFEWTE
ncbi:hypothetical protein IRJ41_021835 [Triplophysa rosa]|uniref:Uncharacterized protein n=1 Tax=Triplophysa rosa TaxID=992332 RepID=A0A9W7X6K1_TRIRA|nr:hypothetical protein IRJ41_021835 [Triplophysa rosa]